MFQALDELDLDGFHSIPGTLCSRYIRSLSVLVEVSAMLPFASAFAPLGEEMAKGGGKWTSPGPKLSREDSGRLVVITEAR